MPQRKSRYPQHEPTRFLTEEEVLQPASPNMNPDDWPCFVLNDATVHGKDGVTLSNLLLAESQGPFTLFGTLADDKKLRHLQLRSAKGYTIRINDVRSFSMAVPPVTIWASGLAGWFEIRPSLVYKTIYNSMTEAVTLYFWLVDLYEETGRQKKDKASAQITVDRIFTMYFAEKQSTLSQMDVETLFKTHAEFLLLQMRKKTDSVDWDKTTILKWLVDLSLNEPGRVSKQGRQSHTAMRKIGVPVPAASQPQLRTADSKHSNTIDVSKDAGTRGRRGRAHTRLTRTTDKGDLQTGPSTPSGDRGIDSEMSDPSLEPHIRRSSRSGKGATLRLAQPTSLRHLPQESDDDTTPTKSRKRRKASLSRDRVEEKTDIDVDDRYRDSDYAMVEPEMKVSITVVSELLPSAEPQGPRGLWRCQKEGCRFEVPGADKPRGRLKVQEHFLEHADEITAREHLVLQEARPHLPVNHLLDMIRNRGITARVEGGEVIDGRVVPQPIKRHLEI